MEGLFKETEYDGFAVNLRIRSWLGLKSIEVECLKHMYKNDWEKVFNPASYAPCDREKDKIEDFCLTTHLNISKVGLHEIGATSLLFLRLTYTFLLEKFACSLSTRVFVTSQNDIDRF